MNLDTKIGFIHLPPFPEQSQGKDRPGEGMDMETMVTAARLCVEVVASHLRQQESAG